MENNKALAVMGEVNKAVIGKNSCIVKVMAAILAGGHILIEDIPGVGKTTMATAFSRAMDIHETRIQFTPDVLPSDIVGFSMYDKETGKFTFRPGAVMCNLLLADEINRTSPKTQSALLQVMEEGKVSVDGNTYELPKPFTVIATQNPVGSAGTQMLPMSQMDRFMIQIKMGYPNIEDEIQIVKGKLSAEPPKAVVSARDILAMKKEVANIYVHDDVYDYIGKLIMATRSNSKLELGVSPRGTIALTQMAKAVAYLDGRYYVIPEDVEAVFSDVVSHRLVVASRSKITGIDKEGIIEEILSTVKKPKIRNFGK